VSLVLHGYFRSSSAWRVRIALRLKGLAYENVFHKLRRNEQNAPEYLAVNPQGLVPALELGGGKIITQSLAICEYLDAVYPEPALLPDDPFQRARVQSFAQVIACDTHPIQNLKILNRLRKAGLDENAVNTWARLTIDEGLSACAALLGAAPTGNFCFGNQPTLADVCLVPQLGNARRFNVELRWPRLLDIERNCSGLPAFREAAPELQPDARE
jgi:maleylpyruvate isomerase